MKACKLLNVTHYFFIRQVGEGLKYYRTMDRLFFCSISMIGHCGYRSHELHVVSDKPLPCFIALVIVKVSHMMSPLR